MKVLHVLHSLEQTYGGPVRAVLDLSARAAEFGLESEVLGFGKLNIPDCGFDESKIHQMPISRPHAYRYAPKLKGWMDRNLARFDAVVLHGMWLYPNLAVSAACREKNIPYACFPHGMLEPWAVYRQGKLKALKKLTYWALWERHVVLGATCLYFTTERERQLAQNTFHLAGKLLVVTPYGVDTGKLASTYPEPSFPLVNASTKTALFLGRLHPKKNVGFLIRAWHKAQPPSEWRLVIAGSGDARYTQGLVNLAETLGLKDSVEFVGFVSGSQKIELLRRASWFLLPSQQENFGIAVLEAISHRCPVVISDQVFIAEVLPLESEVLKLDIDAWVDFIRNRMVDDAWREKLSALDQIYLRDTLSMDKVAKSWAWTLTDSLKQQMGST